ncbi:hypothetical protein Tco_0983549 [Tanacetum coccineum]
MKRKWLKRFSNSLFPKHYDHCTTVLVIPDLPTVQLNTGRPNINSIRTNINTGRPNINSVRTNINTSRTNINSVRPNINTGRTNVNPVRPRVNTVSSMSDSEDSTVTYTEISSPYEDLSDIGSPGAEGPIFQDPPSPDYVPGPEEPEQAPPSPIWPSSILCVTFDPGSLKMFKKRSPKAFKLGVKTTRRTSGNTTRNDPFPPFLLLEAQTQAASAVEKKSNRHTTKVPHLRPAKKVTTVIDPVVSSSSTVTYTSVYTDSEPERVFWGADEELSDRGSPRVIVYGYDGLPMQPVAPPSPDYVPGPEHPPSPDYVPGPEHPPSPVEVPYVPEPEYPEYLVPADVAAPLEDHPLPADASPTALSPGYVADSYPEEDLEEDPEEDPKEDHVDYPTNGGDDDDEPSDDDDDDTDDEDEDPFDDEDDDEEEEHLAPVDSFVIPVVNHVLSAGDTKAFEIDESAPTPRSPQTKVPFAQTRLRRARKTVRLEPPMSPSIEARIIEYAAAPAPPSPPPSPLSPWSPPLPRITSPPLPPPPPSLHLPPPVPTLLPLPSSPLPPLPSSLFIPPPVDRREDIPEAELPPRKRLCLAALTSRYEVGRVRLLLLDLLEDRQTQLFHRVDGLVEDRQFHYETARLLDREALVSREAWAHSVRLSSVVHYELQAYKTHTQMQDYRIASQESLMTTLITHVSSLQGQLSAALGHIQALQARDPTHTDDREGAASTAAGLVFLFLVSDNHNNMSPRRSSATARAVVVAAARAAAAVATEARVSVALANHDTLRNSTNGHGEKSHNSKTRIRGTVCTPHGISVPYQQLYCGEPS